MPALYEVQDKVYDEPTILLAKQVSGEEEIPENAVAVITPDAPDILSHSSGRARNMKVTRRSADCAMCCVIRVIVRVLFQGWFPIQSFPTRLFLLRDTMKVPVCMPGRIDGQWCPSS